MKRTAGFSFTEALEETRSDTVMVISNKNKTRRCLAKPRLPTSLPCSNKHYPYSKKRCRDRVAEPPKGCVVALLTTSAGRDFCLGLAI